MTWGGRVEGSVRRGRGGSDMGWESRREREEGRMLFEARGRRDSLLKLICFLPLWQISQH